MVNWRLFFYLDIFACRKLVNLFQPHLILNWLLVLFEDLLVLSRCLQTVRFFIESKLDVIHIDNQIVLVCFVLSFHCCLCLGIDVAYRPTTIIFYLQQKL